MGESENREQRTENSNVARMKPAEYGNCTLLTSAPVFRSSIQAALKIYMRVSWLLVCTLLFETLDNERIIDKKIFG